MGKCDLVITETYWLAPSIQYMWGVEEKEDLKNFAHLDNQKYKIIRGSRESGVETLETIYPVNDVI